MKNIDVVAKAIYELMPYDGPAHSTKPDWVPNGNSLKQDEARRYADAALRAVRHPSDEFIAALLNEAARPKRKAQEETKGTGFDKWLASGRADWEAKIDYILNGTEP